MDSLANQRPRFRRLLSFGDILDESVRLYREHFVILALFSAVALLPTGLVVIWASAAGLLSTTFTTADLSPGGTFTNPIAVSTQLQRYAGAALGVGLLSGVFGVLWATALVTTCDALLRGQQPILTDVYSTALSRVLVVLLSTIVFALGMLGLTLVGTVLFLVTLAGLLGSLIALIGLLFWWLRPMSRKRWLKWLIILAAPYGLPTYYAFRWSMYVTAAVLERRGPLNALSRSSALTAGRWFRVASILTVAPLIVAVLISVVTTLINLPLTIGTASRGQVGLDPAAASISAAVSLVMQILFESVAMIVYTLLFHDLRNRHEGTDIAERLAQLESAPLIANG